MQSMHVFKELYDAKKGKRKGPTQAQIEKDRLRVEREKKKFLPRKTLKNRKERRKEMRKQEKKEKRALIKS